MEGAGLGLAGGQSNAGVIRVESEPNHGSLFSVFLPQFNEISEVKNEKNIEELPLGSGQTVLLIGDDRMVGLILEKTLLKLDYTPLRYTDPVKAMVYFDEAPARIGAVLSNLSIPELTGRDLAEHMLKARPDLPFIIQSGYIKKTSIRTYSNSVFPTCSANPCRFNPLRHIGRNFCALAARAR